MNEIVYQEGFQILLVLGIVAIGIIIYILIQKPE